MDVTAKVPSGDGPDQLDELVGPPREGRIFEDTVRTGFADCAPSGRARLDALARWLQDVAYGDVEDAGLAAMAVWVVRKTRIRVRRFPRFGERLNLTTFCSGLGRMWGERRTTIRRPAEPQSDVEAVALWVHLDPVNWRPIPFNEQEALLYGSAAAGRRVSARLRHPAPDGVTQSEPWTFRAVDMDIAGHVNNAAYWQPLEEELLSGSEPEQIDAEIEFRAPCHPGEKLLLREGPRRWIVDGHETYASILVADQR
ncbi:MAG TPA: acyl-ACP thioesterase domain-containing protein [Solirubrobacteraceae bacterium]|nr:acyl-ACP thioesterase domain-containing protein [Solirubrobacteraceae bacterium]